MKVTAPIVALLGMLAIFMPQSNARSVLVNQVTSALQDSFNALNAKRGDWLNNYSTMNNITKTDAANVKELLMTSKFVIPLIWQMYTTSVRKQKKFYATVVNERDQSLPFSAQAVPTNMGANMFLEATLLLQQYRDFQVQILMNEVEIFFLDVNFHHRQVVIGHSVHGEAEEKTMLADDHFPEFILNKPFRINVQVVDDCIASSIWLNNLEMFTPMPLPEKHVWCTREYALFDPTTYHFNIHPIGGHLRQFLEEDHDSHEEQEDHESQEDSEYEASNIQLVSAVVYNGIIFQ